MNVYFHYKTIDKPWGGINSFISGLKRYISRHRKDVSVDEVFTKDSDIFLMAAAYAGPGEQIDTSNIRELVDKRDGFFNKLKRGKKFRLVHRLDGLRSFYAGKHIPNDDIQIELSEIADFIIFQSNYSLENFRHFGYDRSNYEIIYNGADQDVFNPVGREFYNGEKIKIFSTSWSDNILKGFRVMADFSELNNTECFFAGRWCPDVDPKNVKIIPPVNQAELAGLYKKADIFLHPAKNDPCPNVVLEALSTGLPVIYHESGGTPELAEDYGTGINDDYDLKILASKLEFIIENYDYLTKKIQSDRKKFSMAAAAENYLKAFEKALKL